MPLFCPNCQASIDADANPGHPVVCTACGSSFRVEAGSTLGWSPGEGPRRFGRFEVLDLLGAGAFGSVYKARDSQLDRLVALKVPRAGSLDGPESLDRFLREGRAVARLTHPHIVPVFEVGQHEDMPFLISEFVQGVTLADSLTARRPSFADAAKLVAALADALHYAHQQGVIHRDVKPNNVLLDAAGSPRLMDFGLARREAGETALTLEGQVVGTPAYMSPEQARGEGTRVDGRTDVYSLGVVLYELLTGEPPFRGNLRMLLFQVLNDEPRPPRALNDRIPADLQTICLKAMAKEQSRRYASAAELAADLRRWLNNEPIQARPPGAWYRLRKFTARNRALVGGVTATIVALLLGVAGVSAALWQTWQESVRRAAALEDANRENQRAVKAENNLRVELTHANIQAARLAAQRGEWRTALVHYDEALAGGLPPEEREAEIALRLGKLDARLALYQYPEFRKELEELAERRDLGKHAALVRLLQGYERFMRTRKSSDDPLAAVREALQLGLPPAEEAYARALLASTVPEAVAHLQKAVELDPFHRRSYEMLPVLLFLLGHMPEARDAANRLLLVAPNSVGGHGYQVFFASLDGDLDGAYRACDRIKPILGADGVSVMRFLARLFHTVQDPSFQWQPDNTKVTPLLLEFGLLAPKLGKMMGDQPDGKAAGWGDFSMFRMPCLEELGPDGLLKEILGGGFMKLAGSPGALADVFGKVLRKMPNGYYYYLQGMNLQGAGRLDEAEAALRLALTTPSFLPIQRRARYQLLMVQWNKSFNLNGPMRWEVHNEMRQNLRRLAHDGSYPAWATSSLFYVATTLDENELALMLSEAWLRLAPNDPKAREAQLVATYRLGAFDQAVEATNELLRLQPGKADWLNQRAVFQFNMGDLEAATASLLEAQKQEPKYFWIESNFRGIEQRAQRRAAAAPLLLAKLRLRSALVRAMRGDHAAAAVLAEPLPPRPDLSGEERVARAGVFSLASTAAKKDARLSESERDAAAERYAQAAVHELTTARREGYFTDRVKVDLVVQDADLQALHERADLQQLHAALKK
jgi:Flp pilus assembly protein TadD/tRNA A-37 threonylcarbamoyl transferase component Bud32